MPNQENKIPLSTLRGLEQETLARIPIIKNPTVNIAPFINVVGLNLPPNPQELIITWKQQKALNGGKISMRFAGMITKRGFAEGDPEFITTYLEVERIPGPQRINPFEGLAVILSSIATINQAAIVSRKKLKYVDIASPHTQKLVKRLLAERLCSYSDRFGMVQQSPQRIDKGLRGLLFTTTFPIDGLQQLLEPFVIKKAAQKLLDLKTLTQSH